MTQKCVPRLGQGWPKYISNFALFFKAFPIIARYADQFIEKLEQTTLEDSTDIKQYDVILVYSNISYTLLSENPCLIKEISFPHRLFGPYSLDVVASSSFSIAADSINNPDDPFIINVKKIINMNFWMLLIKGL